MQPILDHLTVNWHWYALAAYVLVEAWLGAHTEARSTLGLLARLARRILLLVLRRSPAPLVREVVDAVEPRGPGAGVILALMLALGASAHAQMLGPARVDDPPPAPPAVQADMPTPPVELGPWIPLGVSALVAAGALALLLLARRHDARGLVLVAALGLGASGCATWRNDAGGVDPIGEAGRARLAAVVDCLGAAVAVEAGPLLSGALAIVLQGQQREVARWEALLVPFVRAVEGSTRACLKPPPAVAVRVTADPPAITVERAP